jgi:hypothetical protein
MSLSIFDFRQYLTIKWPMLQKPYMNISRILQTILHILWWVDLESTKTAQGYSILIGVLKYNTA